MSTKDGRGEIVRAYCDGTIDSQEYRKLESQLIAEERNRAWRIKTTRIRLPVGGRRIA